MWRQLILQLAHNGETMDEAGLSDRVMAWRRVLSPWIAALWGRLSVTLAEMPQRHDLERDLWIRFTSDDKSDNRVAWLQWLEGFELLDILAARDSRACWDILLDLSNSKSLLPSLGCPRDLFYGLRPRYETTFEFRTLYFPREDVALLISRGIKSEEHTPEYAAAKAELLAIDGPRNASPIQLRWHFPIVMYYVGSDRAEAARYKGRLNHVLALAENASTAHHRTHTPRFEISSIGLPVAPHHSNEARELMHRIASVVPISVTTINQPLTSDQFKTNFYGPFLWRLLAPQRSKRPQLGVQRMVIASLQVQWSPYVAAVCSAIAQSHTLRSLAFNGSHTTWASWLAYALFSKTATHAIDTVSITISKSTPQFVEALRNVVEHTNPVALLAVVHDGDGAPKRSVKWTPTTVRVNAQTPIQVPDHLRLVKTVYHGRQHAVCHVADNEQGEFVRVLIPGVGFGRVHRRDLLGSPEPTPMRETHSVRSLSLTLDRGDVLYLSAFLELIGGPLTTLALDVVRYSQVNYKPLRLTEILAHCPNVKHLTISNLKLQAEMLLPSTRARHLESLKLVACHIVTSDPTYRVCVTPRMAPRLTSFFTTASCTSDGMDLRALATALLTARRLERLVLGCERADDAAATTTYKKLVAEYDGQRMPAIALRLKLAVLSVLATGPRHALCNEIVARIFEMVATPVQRRCCAVVVR